MATMTKSFEQWNIDDVEETFGLKRVLEHQNMNAWQEEASRFAAMPLSANAAETLTALQAKLRLYVDGWNEDELKFRFIAPFINLVDFDIEEYNIHTFTQRPLSAVLKDVRNNDVAVNGRVDFVVATGKSRPAEPYFFLHEYKKEHPADSHPRAQLLVEMLAARTINAAERPFYGCYVVGRNWFFLILSEKIYIESDALVSTNKDIFTIFAMLCATKKFIAEQAKQVNIPS